MTIIQQTAYWDKVLKKFGVYEYHSNGTLGQNVSIYVIDTGINQAESDLQNIKIRSFSVGGSRKVHGSAVTSILKTIVAPQSQIYLADIDNSAGVIYTSSLTQAIRDAIKLNVDIITISLGTNKYDQNLQNAVNEAYQKGILIFAAAGNCSCPDYEFPAACEHAISVGSINPDTLLPSPFNTRNDSNVLFAPGENVQIPKGSGFATVSGTSFSAPFVAGLAALVLSDRRAKDPGFRMEREDMITLLRDSDHLGLSCNVHNYSRFGACGGLSVLRMESPLVSTQTISISVIFVSIFIGLFLAYMYLLNMK